MIDELVYFLAGSVNWLASVLPADPFTGYLANDQSLALGVGWLNWCVPVHDIAVAFTAFVGAVAAKRVGSAVYNVGSKVIGFLVAS